MASTSSVYGANTDMPFTEVEKADTQLSIYAATKANESMAHSYFICGRYLQLCFVFLLFTALRGPDMHFLNLFQRY